MAGYNPYRQSTEINNTELGKVNLGNSSFRQRLAKLSIFGRNYLEQAVLNSKGIHANEDISNNADNGNKYTLFSRKVYAMLQERQKIAALSVDYFNKINIFREYATKGEISEYVSKMANEIIVYSQDNKFCELIDLPQNYSEVIRDRAKSIFDDIYIKAGFTDGSLAWDICRDWLVDGYICREIIYDKRGKNIIGFQKLDPMTIVPMVDEATRLKIWVQYPQSSENRRIFLDGEIIYISYSGGSSYIETSYVEPMIKPYNELKTLERTKILYNIIQTTMHKEFSIPVVGLPPDMAEQEVLTLISDYKDDVTFDDTTGITYINGDKNLPYSKEYWFPDDGNGKAEMNIIEPGGHDLNENSMLIWFKTALKQSSKFPLSRLDIANNGGSLYSLGGELTHDDYNFDQFTARLKSIFKQIILKPITLQLLLEFPELENDSAFLSNIDIKYYGHSEIIKAKYLSNLQAKAAIALDLKNNLTQGIGDNEKPLLHWKMIAKEIMEFDDEFLAENDRYWAEDKGGETEGEDGGGEETEETEGGEETE